MYSLKSIKLYFFSILELFFLNFKNIYFKSNFYNRKLITFIPDRIFYKPSTYLSDSLTTISNDFYKITSRTLKLSKDFCNGKVVSILEGGYDLQALQDSSKRHVDALIEFH